MRIRYLRHGNFLAGGARHEEFLVKKLKESTQGKFEFESYVNTGIFKGLSNIWLFFWGYRMANTDVNIVVSRLAVGSIIRNLFNRKKTIIVMHYYDENDKKGLFLKLYYLLFFKLIRHKNVAVVTVSDFYIKFFGKRTKTFLFPNFFDVNYYKQFRTSRDRRKILLGQYSWKNDDSVFTLSEALTRIGYQCYFCTLDESLVKTTQNYSVKFFKFESYLTEMATSWCSISFSAVNEGWPRMVHESILVGTPVIGFDKGGLGDLLTESSSYIVSSVDEAIKLIEQENLENRASDQFIDKYDVSNSSKFIDPILKFIME